METPILYLLMRSDIPDMNPGKLAAQAAHVGSDFEMWVRNIESQKDQYADLLAEIGRWREGAGTCGTTICLSATESEIVEIMQKTDFARTFYDPTYPWKNWYGELFLSNELTGAWIFVCSENESDREKLAHLDLHS